jgi:hypothetical protein
LSAVGCVGSALLVLGAAVADKDTGTGLLTGITEGASMAEIGCMQAESRKTNAISVIVVLLLFIHHLTNIENMDIVVVVGVGYNFFFVST